MELLKSTKKFLQNFNVLEIIKFLPEYTFEFLKNRLDSFDRQYGVDTTSPVGLSELGVESETAKFAELYWPTNAKNFRKLISAARIPRKNFTFIDIGSGKGRALLLAAEYGFRRIVGVEFSKELTEIAKHNVSIFNKKTGVDSNIEVVNADATNFNFPMGPLFIYLFDPFRAEVMEKVIINLLESLKAEPRDVYVAYYLPMHRELFSKYGFEVAHEQARNFRFDYPWVIFHKSQSVASTARQTETRL